MIRAVTGAIVRMLLVGSVASASGGAVLVQPGTAAARVSFLSQDAVHHRRRHHDCTGACQHLGVNQGYNDGKAYCGSFGVRDEQSLSQPSTVFTFGASPTPPESPAPYFDFPAGDLLVAAFVTEGGAITPPAGWKEVTGSVYFGGTGDRLQMFYEIPTPVNSSPSSRQYSFTSAMPQAISGTLIDATGVSQNDPISSAGGEANPIGSVVTAPSITPAGATTRVIFVGAVSSAETWKAPSGMTSLLYPAERDRIGVAYQDWRAATPTGTRTATIGNSGESVGDLIALSYPLPTTCPMLRILNRNVGRSGPIFKPDASGAISVRLQCEWSTRCVGALGLLYGAGNVLAGGNFTVPAHRTRTFRIYLCRRGSGCPDSALASLLEHSVVSVNAEVVVALPNGQVAQTHVAGASGSVDLR